MCLPFQGVNDVGVPSGVKSWMRSLLFPQPVQTWVCQTDVFYFPSPCHSTVVALTGGGYFSTALVLYPSTCFYYLSIAPACYPKSRTRRHFVRLPLAAHSPLTGSLAAVALVQLLLTLPRHVHEVHTAERPLVASLLPKNRGRITQEKRSGHPVTCRSVTLSPPLSLPLLSSGSFFTSDMNSVLALPKIIACCKPSSYNISKSSFFDLIPLHPLDSRMNIRSSFRAISVWS